MLIQMLPGSGPQGLIDAHNAVMLLKRGITVPKIEPYPGSSNQKTRCWSNSDAVSTVGWKQLQMKLRIQTNQIQTKSPCIFILNLISHYYRVKYMSSFIPRKSLTQRLP